MTNPYGTPIWYEYLAGEADRAKAFYGEVIGWQVSDSGMPGMGYHILTAPDGAGVGGLMALPEGASMPGWHVYFGVSDVDATVSEVQAEGGKVLMPPMTLAGVGRFAMVSDPQGAAFYVMRGDSDQPSDSFRQRADVAPAHMVWNELLTADQEAAMRFYGKLFGWRHEGLMPMGPLGDYKFVHSGSMGLGASMNTQPGEAPEWRFYVYVSDIDSAAARLAAAGGHILRGPDEIPGGEYTVMAEDPFGARFGLVGPRM